METNEPQPTNRDTPTSPTHDRYLSNEEVEGRPTLVSVNEDNVTVDPDEINDDSTGMGKDDYLGKTKREDE